MMRQSYMVLGETISLSLVTVAKSHANNGDIEATTTTLRRAFNACLATAVFGTAFFVVFGDVLLRAILRPEFVAPIHDLIPIFAIAFAFMTMRNFYFAQVIYFTNASFLDLLVSFLFVVVSASLSLVLVPAYGPHGAAVALMLSGITSCIAFMLLGRRWFRLPIDFTALALMPALAVLFVFAAHTTAELMPGGPTLLIVDALAFALAGGFAVRRFGLLNATPAVTILGVMPLRVGR
jgi:O-antigen/teichoic acid export membrane protein